MDVCNCNICELRDMFFENVSKDEIKDLCSNKVEVEHRKGNYIIERGADIVDFMYLKTGLVKLYIHNDDGREQIISFAKPKDFVSMLSIFSGDKYTYSVKAVEDSVTCNIKMSEIKHLAETNGKFALNLLQRMSKVSDNIILDSLEVRKRKLNGRVAYILLFFKEHIYNSNEFELPVSRKEIAEYIGMTTENVIRTLTEFRKDKIIKIYGKVIEICDLDRLEGISKHG